MISSLILNFHNSAESKLLHVDGELLSDLEEIWVSYLMLSLRWAEKMESWMSTPRNCLMTTASHSSQITKWPAIRYFSKFFKSKESLKSKILCVNEELLSHLEEIEYTETLRNRSKTTIWSSWHIRGWNSRVRHTCGKKFCTTWNFLWSLT